MFSKFVKRQCEIINLNNNLYNKRDILRTRKHAFFKTFIFMLTSTLTTSSIIDSIKTMFDLRFINIIENCERKQKIRTCKHKQKH